MSHGFKSQHTSAAFRHSLRTVDWSLSSIKISFENFGSERH